MLSEERNALPDSTLDAAMFYREHAKHVFNAIQAPRCLMAQGSLYTRGWALPNAHAGQRFDISSDIFCTRIPPSPLGLSARDEQRVGWGWGGLLHIKSIDFIKVEQQPWFNLRLKCRINASTLHSAKWCQKNACFTKWTVYFIDPAAILLMYPRLCFTFHFQSHCTSATGRTERVCMRVLILISESRGKAAVISLYLILGTNKKKLKLNEALRIMWIDCTWK